MRRLSRVRSPLPISHSFAAAVRAEEMSRGFEQGGGSKRRFEEDRSGGRFYFDGPNRRHVEEERELRRESQLRDQVFREWGQMQAGGNTTAERRRRRTGRERQISGGSSMGGTDHSRIDIATTEVTHPRFMTD